MYTDQFIPEVFDDGLYLDEVQGRFYDVPKKPEPTPAAVVEVPPASATTPEAAPVVAAEVKSGFYSEPFYLKREFLLGVILILIILHICDGFMITSLISVIRSVQSGESKDVKK